MLAPRTMGTSTAAGTLSLALLAGSGASGRPAAGDPPAPAPRTAQGVALELQDAFAAVAEQALPSIVTVAAYVRETEPEPAPPGQSAWIKDLSGEYPGFRRIGSGSGVVLSAAGDVLTNRHFLLQEDGQPADLIDVETADNRHTLSRVVGMEPTLNLAVVALEVFSKDNPPAFKPLPIGNSAALLPGHMALALGDPFGPEKFLAPGVFSATASRECYQEQLTATFLQVALVLHPGAYGGALVNLRGEYVGMLTPRNPVPGRAAAASGTGLEFALPSNIIQGLYGTIKRNESFQSPWLGYAVMSVGELRKELGAQAFAALPRPRVGIYIENVFSPSPAFAAGVQVGDFLTKFNDTLIGSPLDFQKQLYMAGIGSRVRLELFRAGETYAREISVELRPPEAITR
jgi:serine protease Do